MADDSDTLAGMYYGLSDDAQRQAMANALRQNQQMQGMGALGQAFGDLNPGIGALGREQAQAAGQRMQQLERGPLQGAQAQEAIMKLAQAKRRNDALASPDSALNQVRSGLWKQLGGEELPAGFNTGDLTDQEMSMLEKLQAAKERAAMMRQLHGLGANGYQPLSDDAIQALADVYKTSHTIPGLAKGVQTSGDRARIINAATRAQQGAPVDLVGTKADTEATTHALKQMVEREATTGAFEATAEKNLDNFVKAAQVVPDWGSQTLNGIVRAVAEKGGSPAMASFRAAHEAAASEAAKVLSGALGAGATSDAGKHAAEMMLNPNATVAQLQASAQTLRQDMAARKQANHDAIQALRSKVSGRQPAQTPVTEEPMPAAIGGAPAHAKDPRYLYNKADGGKTRILKGPDGKPAPGAKPEASPGPMEVASNG